MKRIISLAPFIFFLISGCRTKPETITPSKESVIEAVYASGYLLAINEHTLAIQKNGVLKQKFVDEGEAFKKGETLLLFDDGITHPKLAIALNNLTIAQQNASESGDIILRLKNQLQIIKERKDLDSINVGRYQRLYEQKISSKIQLDNIELAYAKSSKEFESLENQLAQTRNEVESALQNAKSNLLLLQNELGFFNIKAPFDGVLLQTNKEIGEFFRAGEPVATIGSNDGFYCQLKVDEQDIEKIKIGQKVLITTDAFPNKIFNAKVSKIIPKVNIRDQSFRVDAQLLDDLPNLFSGLTLEANIIIRESNNSLIIPSKYILPGDTVLILEDGELKKRAVKPGIKTSENTEIIEGLTPETSIVMP